MLHDSTYSGTFTTSTGTSNVFTWAGDVAKRAEMSGHREVRIANLGSLEVRADDDGTVTFDGIASAVDTPYKVRDLFGEYQETISKGAFNRTIKQKDDVRLLVNHEGVPLARTKSKTLELSAAPDLRAVARLDPSNPTVQEIRSAMDRGDMDQMSIGFRVRNQTWSSDYTERTIKEVELFDVSLVTFPASPTTSASLRSIAEVIEMFPLGCEVDADELRRAIAHLNSLLPQEQEEIRETGLIVTDELISLWDLKRTA